MLCSSGGSGCGRKIKKGGRVGYLARDLLGVTEVRGAGCVMVSALVGSNSFAKCHFAGS